MRKKMPKCVTRLTRIGDLRRNRLIFKKKKRGLFPFLFLFFSSPFSLTLPSLVLWSSSVRCSLAPNGRFLLVGCGGYITPPVTRTSSCFLQPRLKVESLVAEERSSIQSSRIQCASETHSTRSLSFALSLSLSLPFSL